MMAVSMADYMAHGLGRVPDAELARKLKMSRQAVAKARARAGLPPVRPAMVERRRESVRALVGKGLTQQEIAERTGSSYSTVLADIKALGLAGSVRRPATTQPYRLDGPRRTDRKSVLSVLRTSKTNREVCERLGIDPTNLSSLLTSADLYNHPKAAKLREASGGSAGRDYTLTEADVPRIEKALLGSRGFLHAAKALGVNRKTLRFAVARLGIDLSKAQALWSGPSK